MDIKQVKEPVKLGRRFGGTGRGVSVTAAGGDKVLAFLLVKKPNYVPAGVSVRERQNEFLFTADIPRELIEAIDRDPAVRKCELSTPLPLIAPVGASR